MQITLKKFNELTKDGKIFTVTFTKKDGTSRTMNCRTGVKKYLKGGELKYNPSEHGYVIVYDLQTKGYRTINTNTITELKVSNKVFVEN